MTNKRVRDIIGKELEFFADESKTDEQKQKHVDVSMTICSLAKQYINSLDIAVRMRKLDIEEDKVDAKAKEIEANN